MSHPDHAMLGQLAAKFAQLPDPREQRQPQHLLGGVLVLLPACSTLPDGSRAFLGLNSTQWGQVGQDVGNAALRAGAQAGVVSYGTRRAVTAAKNPVEVEP